MFLRFLLRRGLVYILPVAVLLLLLSARIAAPGLLDRLMLISFDFYQRIAPRESSNSSVRIVDIDNDSLKQYGQWPWPRGLDAEMVDKLREAGAAIVAFDIVFSEPDRTSPKVLLDSLKQRGEVSAEIVQLLSNRCRRSLDSFSPTKAKTRNLLPRRVTPSPETGRCALSKPIAPQSPIWPSCSRPPPATAFSTAPSIGTTSSAACH
jgi:adenylate cyclase